MATYKEISGLNIKTLSSDPSNLNEGEMWYNTTSNTLKGALIGASAWASAPALSVPRAQGGTAGTVTAALYYGGTNPSNTSETEEYNGSSWTAGGAMNTGRADLGGAGTQTAGLAFGGQNPGHVNITEEYNGTGWTTSPGTMPSSPVGTGYGGTQTAALSAAGAPSTVPAGATTSAEYDGATWTGGGTMNTGRRDLAKGVTGTQTAGLALMGRISGTSTDAVEEYNGATWTSVTSYPVALRAGGSAGTQISALVCGGQTSSGVSPTNQNTSKSYDGTSWTAQGNLGTAIYMSANVGVGATASLCCGGWRPAVTTAVEEYSPGVLEVQTVTTS